MRLSVLGAGERVTQGESPWGDWEFHFSVNFKDGQNFVFEYLIPLLFVIYLITKDLSHCLENVLAYCRVSFQLLGKIVSKLLWSGLSYCTLQVPEGAWYAKFANDTALVRVCSILRFYFNSLLTLHCTGDYALPKCSLFGRSSQSAGNGVQHLPPETELPIHLLESEDCSSQCWCQRAPYQARGWAFLYLLLLQV